MSYHSYAGIASTFEQHCLTENTGATVGGTFCFASSRRTRKGYMDNRLKAFPRFSRIWFSRTMILLWNASFTENEVQTPQICQLPIIDHKTEKLFWSIKHKNIYLKSKNSWRHTDSHESLMGDAWITHKGFCILQDTYLYSPQYSQAILIRDINIQQHMLYYIYILIYYIYYTYNIYKIQYIIYVLSNTYNMY